MISIITSAHGDESPLLGTVKRALEGEGVEYHLIRPEEVIVGCWERQVLVQTVTGEPVDPKLVLCTLDRPEEAEDLLDLLERCGATIINPPSAVRTAKRPLSAALSLGRFGVPQAAAFATFGSESIAEWIPTEFYPLTVCSLAGADLSDQPLQHDASQASELRAQLQADGPVVLQAVLMPTGRERVQVYVVEEEVVWSQAARSAQAEAVAKESVQALGLDMARVDLAPCADGYAFMRVHPWPECPEEHPAHQALGPAILKLLKRRLDGDS